LDRIVTCDQAREVGHIDELGNLDCVFGWHAKTLQLRGLNDDVMTFAVPVAFDDLVPADDRTRLVPAICCALKNLLLPDPLAGGSANLIKADCSLASVATKPSSLDARARSQR
jgi:hypothetical protein